MKRVDMVVSAVFFLLGLWVLWQATMLPQFSVFGPGPEFMPNVAGILLMALSALLFVASWRNPPEPSEDMAVDREGVYRVVVMIVALFFYTALLEVVGYLVLTFAYATFMLLALARYRWYIDVAIAAAITLLFYQVFVGILQVPAPRGILGI